MKILRASEVVDRVGYSRFHIWRLEQAGQFPRRVQLGPRTVGWVESEVDAWIKERIDQRDASAPEAA